MNNWNVILAKSSVALHHVEILLNLMAEILVSLMSEFRVIFVSFIGDIFNRGAVFRLTTSGNSNPGSGPNTPNESEVKCMCGLVAKRRISKTRRNWMRPFFNCPKEIGDQCRFFQWAPEFYEADGESNSNHGQSLLLQRRIMRIEYEREEERAEWDREKMELEAQISALKSQLDSINDGIKLANETENMPPLDKVSLSDNEADDAVAKHMV